MPPSWTISSREDFLSRPRWAQGFESLLVLGLGILSAFILAWDLCQEQDGECEQKDRIQSGLADAFIKSR